MEVTSPSVSTEKLLMWCEDLYRVPIWNIWLGTRQPLLYVSEPAWGELFNVC